VCPAGNPCPENSRVLPASAVLVSSAETSRSQRVARLEQPKSEVSDTLRMAQRNARSIGNPVIEPGDRSKNRQVGGVHDYVEAGSSLVYEAGPRISGS